MESIRAAVSVNQVINLAVIVGLLVLFYYLYTYLFPSASATYMQLLETEKSARQPITPEPAVPRLYTGGDFTFSLWFYIDDWNYRSNQPKFLFSIGPANAGVGSTAPNLLTAVFTPYRNAMLLQGNVAPTNGVVPTGSGIPNINLPSNLADLMSGKMTTEMYNSALTSSPEESGSCNLMEVPVQRWTCLTVVSSGRLLDVYLDGKLTRSCMLSNMLSAPRGAPLSLRMGNYGGFGGNVSQAQIWTQQLTPDMIYSIYRAGPTQSAVGNLFSDIKSLPQKLLGVEIVSTRSADSGSSCESTCQNGIQAWTQEQSCNMASC